MGKDVIIACDFPSEKEVIDFLAKFNEKRPFVKIGMELFYSSGPDIVKKIKQMGHKIFLDLKLCDIPNTVEKSMRVLSRLDVDMVNVHAFGTKEMMSAALRGLTREDGTRPLIVAVTQLTSTSEERMKNDLLINQPLEKVVCHYAKCACDSGLDGVVCSPREATLVKSCCGNDFVTVTPGIRFSDSAADDQVRIMTPERAKNEGCDYIVVGRPITQADDPEKAYKRCMAEFID